MSLRGHRAQKKEDFDDEAYKLFKKLGIDINDTQGSAYDDLNVIFVNPNTGHKVFCGNINAASNLSILKANGINHVVNCQDPSSQNFHENNQAANVTYFRFPIAHWHNSRSVRQGQAYDFFVPFFNFVDNATKTGNVLIHCLAGAHRAGTSSVSYILYKTRTDVPSAI